MDIFTASRLHEIFLEYDEYNNAKTQYKRGVREGLTLALLHFADWPYDTTSTEALERLRATVEHTIATFDAPKWSNFKTEERYDDSNN